MKKISLTVFTACAVLIFNSLTNAQGFYSMGNGSYMTGYGQVYGSFGYAMALQNMHQTIQMNLQRSMARAAMVKKWGEPRVKQAEENARRNSNAGKSSTTSSHNNNGQNAELNNIAAPPVPKYYGRFRPDTSVNMAKTLSDLFEKNEEREQMKLVVQSVQQIYKDEAAKRGWGNNLAGGMTFFLVTMSMVYHNTDQPSDEAIKAIYEAVNLAVDDVPDFANASNADKHKLNDMLVGFSALPFLTFIEGKRDGNTDTVQTAQILAGEMLKMVLKTDPKNIRLDNNSLTISR